MFKVGRWRSEKIKVVFRLQFQATQVPCSKSRLMISLVPVDVGQPTVRLGKAAVQDGTCTWENPVFESVKFTRETKSGKLQDKFYHFIISTGSSKSGFSGEVSVNLADYVEATKPFTISLPIKPSNSGAILHVTIQNMQGADDERLQSDIDENGGSRSSLQSQLSNSHTPENEYDNTAISPDDKRRLNSRNGNSLNSVFQRENSSDESSRDSVTRALDALDLSSEEDVKDFPRERTEKNFPAEKERGPPFNRVEQLEKENLALKRQAEVTEIEVLSLRRQVVKETKKGQDLSGQVARLREERNALRAESEKLLSLQKGDNGVEIPKDMSKALRSQLRKAQDSNSELILAVRGLKEKLAKKDKEIADLSNKLKSEKKVEEFHNEDSDLKEVDLLREQIKELQTALESQVKEKRRLEKQIEQLSEDYENSKQEYNDLSSKFNQKQLELIKKEKENSHNLRKVEEVETHIARLEKVIKTQAEEFAESSDMMSELEAEVNSLRDELEMQEQRALEAEESLRKTKVENANAAQRVQEEFQKLSEELASQFKENEDLTVKAETEARELRLHISVLEENLEKANEEIELVQDKCEIEVERLSVQIRENERELERLILLNKNESGELGSAKQRAEERCEALSNENQALSIKVEKYEIEVEQLSVQLRENERQLERLIFQNKNESEKLGSAKKKAEEKCEALSNENQALSMEVERLTEENYYFTKQLEEMNRKRDVLEKENASARMEIEQSKEELKSLRSLKEKEGEMDGVKSKLVSLGAQHDELKTRLSELKSENENLKKQVSRQKESLQKKDHEIANLEKLKNSSSKEVSVLKEKVKQLKAVRPAGISPENGSKAEERKFMGKKLQQSEASGKSLQNGANRTLGERKEALQEKKVPDPQTSDLLAEVALLKEKNKSMEDDLKEMQDKYSEVSLKFAEVEGERQHLVMTIRNLRNSQKK